MTFRRLHTETEVNLDKIPEAMIFQTGKKRLSKLVKNAEEVLVRVLDMDMLIKPQKTAFLDSLDKADSDAVYLAVFNGLKLTVYGEIEVDEEEDDDET